MRNRKVKRKIGRNIEKAIKSALNNDSRTASLPQGPIILFAAPVNSLNTSTLAAQLTAYYQEHMEGIHSELELSLFEGPFSLERNFTTLTGIEDEYVLSSVTMSSFIRQIVPTDSSTFNPVGGEIIPDARILKMRDFQGDLQFKDDEIQRTHLMYQSRMKQLAKSDSPNKTQTFIEYLFWEVIMKRAKRDLRTAVFKATFDNTAPYSLLKIMNGFEKIISDEIVATAITAIALGSITPANAIVKVESVFDTLDEAVKTADDLIVSLNTPTFTAYSRAEQLSLGRNSTYSEGQLKIANFPNATVIHEPDQVATKVACYRKGQAFLSTHSGNEGTWEFQRFNKETKMMLTGKIGLQFQTINPGGKNNIAIGQ